MKASTLPALNRLATDDLARAHAALVDRGDRRDRFKSNTKLAESKPHFRSPPGVVLRMLATGEENLEPVLVCISCNAPTVHDVRGDHVARCQTCKRDRPW